MSAYYESSNRQTLEQVPITALDQTRRPIGKPTPPFSDEGALSAGCLEGEGIVKNGGGGGGTDGWYQREISLGICSRSRILHGPSPCPYRS